MKTTRQNLPVAILTFVLVATVPAACGGGSGGGGNGYVTGPGGNGGGGGGSSASITMADYYFSPAVDTVAAGTTVTWTNTTNVTHTSTSDSGVWDSGDVTAGKTYSRTFSTAGTYPYHCKYHVALGMKGSIVVK